MAKLRTRRRGGGSGEAKLNITSMMDMFTIILVFLLKSFSAQGQLVAPAKGLTIPQAMVDSTAVQALDVEVSMDHVEKGRQVAGQISVGGKTVVLTNEVRDSRTFLIEPLEAVLKKYSEEAKKAADLFKQEFKGDINIQADTAVTYDVLTKIMFTCGQAGFPNMQMVVFKNE